MASELSAFIFGVHALQGASISLIHAAAGINHLASGAWKWKHGHLVQIRQRRSSAKYFRARTKSTFYSNRLEQKWRERASRRVDYLRFSCQRALAKWREYIKKSARRYPMPPAPWRRCIFISRSQYMFVKYFFKRTMMKRLFPRRMRCRLFSCVASSLFNGRH
jgi:hypothetical protein